MIGVKVEQVFLSNMGFVVLLKGIEDKRTLPIFIGPAEAQSVAIKLNNIELPRPLTHDLLKNILDFLECRLKRVEVCDLKEGTFYARLVLEKDEQEMTIDCRPSDAIALALRADAPIFVDEDVMDEAGRVLETSGETIQEVATSSGSSTELSKEKKVQHHPSQKKHASSPLEQLKILLEKAIQEERYEDAARLRDEIKRLEEGLKGN
jgi:bifunctional DNase/RNase